MGLFDRFKQKKAVLVLDQKIIPPSPPENKETVIKTPQVISSLQVLSQKKALKAIRKKKKSKKISGKNRKKLKTRKRKILTAKKRYSPSHKKKLQKEKVLLADASKDLSRELQMLYGIKKRLETKIKRLSLGFKDTQNQMLALQKEILRLAKKENSIMRKKKIAKGKITQLERKAKKVKNLQSKLKHL